MTESTTWLTQEAYDRLTSELAELTGPVRADIVDKIDSARQEGDLSENGGYHAAREEQARNEARIVQLQSLLRTAKVGEAPADDGVVEPGMVVTVTLDGNEMTFLLGSREIASGTDLDVYSSTSPLGQAIVGKTVGDTTSYEAPNGKEFQVKVLKAKPFDPSKAK